MSCCRYCLQSPVRGYAALYAPIKLRKALLCAAIEILKKKPMLTTAQVARQAIGQASKNLGSKSEEAEIAAFIDSHLLAWLMVGPLTLRLARFPHFLCCLSPLSFLACSPVIYSSRVLIGYRRSIGFASGTETCKH